MDDDAEFYLKEAYGHFSHAEDNSNLHNKIDDIVHGLKALCYHLYEVEKEMKEEKE